MYRFMAKKQAANSVPPVSCSVKVHISFNCGFRLLYRCHRLHQFIDIDPMNHCRLFQALSLS